MQRTFRLVSFAHRKLASPLFFSCTPLKDQFQYFGLKYQSHHFCTLKMSPQDTTKIVLEDFEEDQTDEDFSQYSSDVYLKIETTAIKQILATSHIPRKKSQKIQRWKKLESFVKKYMSELEEDSKKPDREKKARMATLICFMHPFILTNAKKEIENIENYGYQKESSYAELREISKIVKSQFFVDEILKRYSVTHGKHRAFMIKFIVKYHLDNQAITQRLLSCIRNFPISSKMTTERHLIRYWTELAFLLEQLQTKTDVITSEEFSYIMKNIYEYLPKAPLIEIKNFVSTFKVMENFSFNMEELVQTDRLVETVRQKFHNMKEGLGKREDVLLLYVISKMYESSRSKFTKDQREEIKGIVTEIYDFLRSQAAIEVKRLDMNNEDATMSAAKRRQLVKENKPNFYSNKLLYINYLLGSFRLLRQYEPVLYQFCEDFFFYKLTEHSFNSIEAFTCERMNLLRFMIKGIMMQANYDDKTKKAKMGTILKQHRAFSLRFVQKFQSSNIKITIGQFLRIMYLNQSLPIKSRQIRRVISQVLEASSSEISEADKALGEIILQKFAKD